MLKKKLEAKARETFQDISINRLAVRPYFLYEALVTKILVQSVNDVQRMPT